MFNFMKREIDKNIYAPVVGESIPLIEVPDKVFSTKMLGDGLAFAFEGDTVYSPCDGEIIFIAKTKHAIGIKADNGLELLIHVGLDTVSLNGKGIDVLIKENTKIRAGMPLIKLDREFMEENSINLIMPLIITSPTKEVSIEKIRKVNLKSIIFKIK